MNFERLPMQPIYTGTPAAWLDAYITAASRMRPQDKPSTISAAALAAWPAQGWLQPAMVACTDAMLGPA